MRHFPARAAFALVIPLGSLAVPLGCGADATTTPLAEAPVDAAAGDAAPAKEPVGKATDASVVDAQDAGPTAPTKADVFLAFGKMGRTIMSCDDGVTWINNRSDDDKARCWVDKDPNYVECDHHATSSVGLDVASDGWFYAQYGWGFNGTVRRSRNGVAWETVRKDGWGGGLAVSGTTIFSLWSTGWATSAESFDHGFAHRAGQKLFVVGRLKGELGVSLDAGSSWTVAPTFGSGSDVSFAEGNGILVATMNQDTPSNPSSRPAFASRSSDNGKTWQNIMVDAESWSANVIFNGSQFVNWSAGRTLRSSDGVKWTSAAAVGAAKFGGSVALNLRTGTYATVVGNWGAWYDNQVALRSTDGITWTKLDAAHFAGGHPIVKVVQGAMDIDACKK
jgi:hypothetical protein